MFPGSEVFFLVAGATLGVVLDRLVSWWSATTREHELWFSISVEGIRQRGPADALSEMSMTVDGEALDNPCVLDIYVWAAGDKDIWTDAFEGVAFKIGLQVKLIRILERESTHDEGLEHDFTREGQFVLQPGTVRRNFAVRYRVLVDGVPTLDLPRRPIDTEVSYFEDVRSERIRGPLFRPSVLIGLMLVGPLLLGIGFAMNSSPDGSHFTGNPAAIVLMIAGGIALITAVVLMAQLTSSGPRRAVRARRRLRRALGAHALEDRRLDPFVEDA
jgi:hypothetical protein